ncbi:MAG: PHP domain-containing protein [Caldicoprobacterales bacterium]|jgi:PHP family Zn ribbon phosphoesterase|nr:PHP domain-containing protein [Clostridiales bacterium]
MEAAIDLHIHSALSPCSDDDMTPNNIVNMALLNGLHAIAVTDHNSCDNVEAVMKVAKDRLVVVPGMELQTREEVHLLAYFKDMSSLYSFRTQMEQYYNGIPNNPDFFGHQWIMNELDEITGERQQSLLTSLSLSFEDTVELIRRHQGLPVPAHINKPSYSVLSQLGFLPPDLGLTLLEFSQNFPFDFLDYPNSKFLISSDAHELGQILHGKMTIPVENITIEGIYMYLSRCFI